MTIQLLDIPVITGEQMKEIDRLMVEKYGFHPLQQIENAGRSFARLSRFYLQNTVQEKRILILAGKGANGGSGLVAARYLSNWGAQVTLLVESTTFTGTAEIQWQILQHLPIRIEPAEQAAVVVEKFQPEVVLDALLDSDRQPGILVSKLIDEVNRHDFCVLSLGVPSGMDALTGQRFSPCIRAQATLALALPRYGLIQPESAAVVGDLFVADIGVPPVLFSEIGIQVGPIFAAEEILDLQHLNDRGFSNGNLFFAKQQKVEEAFEKSMKKSCLHFK